ncbi:MAG: peptidase M75, partial [Bacteroidaceae bacterium]|nr:peptidase M75 [Bacteroidaceae bacterium]
MKKTFFLMSLAVMGLTFNSCSDSDNNSSKDITEDEAQNLDYTSENAAAWGNYAVNVARLLANDSKELYNKWANEYADGFKNHDRSITGYSTAIECVEEIIEGSIDIASEVGTQKIGEPVGYWNNGQRTKALYAVESWYSFHSREDYMN